MARPNKKTDNKPVWAICIHHSDGTFGWLIGEDADVKTYSTPEEAEKDLKRMKRGDHYSWNVQTEVKEFTGFSSKKEVIKNEE